MIAFGRCSRLLGGFLLLNSLAAAGGAVALATGVIDLGPEITARLPLDSPVLGGCALALVVAIPLAVAGTAALRGEPTAPELVIGAGTLLVAWIVVQVAIIRSFSWFQPFYATVGAAMVVLGARARAHRPRAIDRQSTSQPSIDL